MTTTKRALKLQYSKTPEYLKSPHGYCAGCASAQAFRMFTKVMGDKWVFVKTMGCTIAATGVSEQSNVPDFDVETSLFGNTGMFAGGLKAGLVARGDTETVVACFVGDGAAADIGMGGISGAAERNDDILYACYDNESYQNTGNQRSSQSPWQSTNTTTPAGFAKKEFKKDMAAILAAHFVPYVATATVAYPRDLMRKVQKAKSIKGFRYLHILCPCPTGWGFPAELTVEMSRLLVDTKIFPLYEVENGINYTINRQPKETPISKYVKMQRRWRGMTDEDLLEFERNIEERWKWLVHLAGYKSDDGGQAK